VVTQIIVGEPVVVTVAVGGIKHPDIAVGDGTIVDDVIIRIFDIHTITALIHG
jgi:hypothetical protein